MLHALGQMSDVQAILLAVAITILALVVLPVVMAVAEVRKGPLYRFVLRHQRALEVGFVAFVLANGVFLARHGEWDDAILLTLVLLVPFAPRRLPWRGHRLRTRGQ